ncbi:MAG TPA: type II toxin-antitoxin system HicB family antitoxin [Allosphingosinicella sp.]
MAIGPLSDADGGGFLATVPEPPGCLPDGETRAEALADAEGAIAASIPCAREAGEPIAEPRLHRAS